MSSVRDLWSPGYTKDTHSKIQKIKCGHYFTVLYNMELNRPMCQVSASSASYLAGGPSLFGPVEASGCTSGGCSWAEGPASCSACLRGCCRRVPTRGRCRGSGGAVWHGVGSALVAGEPRDAERARALGAHALTQYGRIDDVIAPDAGAWAPRQCAGGGSADSLEDRAAPSWEEGLRSTSGSSRQGTPRQGGDPDLDRKAGLKSGLITASLPHNCYDWSSSRCVVRLRSKLLKDQESGRDPLRSFSRC